MPKYPSPGRGAWTLKGGLLPVKPGSSNKAGYYRLSMGTEVPIGAAWLTQEDTSHDAYVVHLGVKAVQYLLSRVQDGVTQDGWYGPATHQAVVKAQAKLGLEADGIVGPASMKAFLLKLLIDLGAHNSVPVAILGGLLTNESALDPAAVGVNGQDHGLAQINLQAHPTIDVIQAIDPDDAVTFAVEDLSHVHATWDGHTAKGVDPWDIAIANHNSPLLAKRWAISGEPPVVNGRVFQIADYVERVHTLWQ